MVFEESDYLLGTDDSQMDCFWPSSEESKSILSNADKGKMYADENPDFLVALQTKELSFFRRNSWQLSKEIHDRVLNATSKEELATVYGEWAARYIEMNPVAAKLTALPRDYRWSSAKAHLTGKDDQLVKVAALLGMVGNWKDFLCLSTDEELDQMHRHERTGRPLGAESFLDNMEQVLGRTLRPQKPGPEKSRSES